MPPSQRKPQRPAPASTPDRNHDIDPRWLLKMLAVVVGAALFCGYLTLCGLFYQGQWQFVLHPDTATKAAPPASLPFEDVLFDYSETGQPQLHGWWIPAAPAPAGSMPSRYSSVTVLYLHGGSGSLADTLPRLQELHNAGLNVFAFDYRGFGQSAGPHPTEQRMREDAAAAWLYVTQKRSMPETQIIPYGEGVGGALAVQLAMDHRRVPALVLDQPVFDLAAQVKQDPRTHLIPVRLLLRERFDITQPLATLQTPKLLLLGDVLESSTPAALDAVADPKFTIHTGFSSAAARTQSLSRFLDEYLPASTVLPQ